MPVYTVHAPVADGAEASAPDSFTFVRDGFHFWAAALSVFWLVWNRLWLALIGWIAASAAIQFAMMALGAGRGSMLLANLLIALLMGFEAASLQRWTLSRRNWRQIDIVVADDEEAAEHRFRIARHHYFLRILHAPRGALESFRGGMKIARAVVDDRNAHHDPPGSGNSPMIPP